MNEDRGGKRDRLARFYRVVQYLEAHPEGAHPEAIAQFVGMSRRTVYRDLVALERELGIPVWNEAGAWGVDAAAFLPPLKLTQAEAMAVVLAARLIVRHSDRYDPELAAAFQKLADVLPEPLRGQVIRTLDLMARRPRDDAALAVFRGLTRALVERRIVTFTYAPGWEPGRPARQARVRPYLLEPSVTTHATYLIGHDEVRGATRTFKLDRIRDLSLTPERFELPEAGAVETSQAKAWGIIADQDEVEVVLRFDPTVAGRVQETSWHPTQAVESEPDGSLIWRARVAGVLEIRLWILSWGSDVEVLAPEELRADVALIYRAAAARYGAPTHH